MSFEMEKQKGLSRGTLAWARAHPWQAAARSVWVLVALAWGAASGAFVAWGPLMAGWPVMVLFGLLCGGLHGGLWLRQTMAAVRHETSVARSWRRALILANAGIFLTVVAVAGCQLYRIGAFPPLRQDRMVNFDRLTKAMTIAYPYFDLKGVDWTDLVEQYRPQIAQAESDEATFAILDRFLAELDDGHTGVMPSPLKNEGCSFVETREIEGQAVVVRTAGNALEAGLVIGSTIQSVDGRPLERALAAVDPCLRVGSTPRQRRAQAFRYLLTTPFGTERRVTFRTPGGEERRATLICSSDPAAAAEAAKGGDIWSPLLPVAQCELVSRRLPSGVGYIHIPTFGRNLVPAFDAALDGMLDAPGLILDVRGNGGGSSAYADEMAGRLLREPFAYGRDTYAARLPTRAWSKRMTFRVIPRAPIYEGPVVVVMDTRTFSSAEQFLVSLVDSGRVRTVGRPTGGGSGNPTVFRLPGARDVRFSTANFIRNDGTPIEGVGLTPDVPVSWTLEDVHQGRDPDLEAAERLLLEGTVR